MANRNTRIQGQGVQTLAAGAKITIEPKNLDNLRTQFVVSNLETVASANVLYICSTDGKEALAVFPQTAVTLETDCYFVLKNPTASTCSYIVGELFFLGGHNGSAGSAGGASSGGSGGSVNIIGSYGTYQHIGPGGQLHP